MKKLFLFALAALFAGSSFADNLPSDLFVASQNVGVVQVYNCKTKETFMFSGYLRDIGVDNKHNLYVLVSNAQSGWGDYTVYKNNSNNVYMSFRQNANGIYSSMAMTVKNDNVVVCGVQSKGFNNKGYESRMIGYVNNVKVFETGYDRKSLKRDNFKGYMKVQGSTTKKQLAGYGNENNSGNPQGDELSCVYHVDAVDYCDGYIYATGWGEREYTETPVGYQKYYLVRRCPRVWKNGAEVVQQYENRTGAAWNISVFKQSGKELIFTSGHQRSVACAWEHSTDQYNGDGFIYPGIISEATFLVASNNQGPIYCRTFLCKKTSAKYAIVGRFIQNGKVLGNFSRAEAKYHHLVPVNKGYYALMTNSNGCLEVRYEKGCEMGTNGFNFKQSGSTITLPKGFTDNNCKIAVRE